MVKRCWWSLCVIVIHKGKLTDFDSEDAVTKDNLKKSGKNKRMLPFAFCLLVTVFCRWFMLHFSLNRYVPRPYNYSASLCYLLNVCGSWSLCRYSWFHATGVTGCVLCSVSLSTLTAIIVDRLFALLLGLRNEKIVTLRRTYTILAIIWVVSLVADLFFNLNYLVTL